MVFSADPAPVFNNGRGPGRSRGSVQLVAGSCPGGAVQVLPQAERLASG